ncbi:glutathione S-transferase 3 [Phlyctema vagabunda]|uniref:glutathione transferase n=1 Tax=Phlyctema vagabunda TaxID=108571 RepID=A0ABR4P3T1_9HELO
MSPLKLYGNIRTTCTRRVLLTAAELGQDLDLITVDIASGEQKKPDYLNNVHPWGKVPALVDEEANFTMHESRAIARYLSSIKFPDHGGRTLVPSPTADPKAYALFEQAASVETANLDPFLFALVKEKFFVPMFGGTPNDEKITESRNILAAALDIYDKILAERMWLAGNDFTLVDLFHVPLIELFSSCDEMELINSRPHVKAWWERIVSRDSFKKVYSA